MPPRSLFTMCLKRLLSDMDSFFDRDPAARSRLEIFLCYPGFHALAAHRATHRLWVRHWWLPARFISQIVRFFTGIEIHPGAIIGDRFFIDHGMGVVIGETARIGNDVTMYHGVTLGGTSARPGIRHPQVGNNVIIGSGAQLLGPITVGDGARIGSNAVVVRDVEPNATMVGVPARKVEDKAQRLKRDDRAFAAYGTEDGEQDPRQVVIDTLMKDMDTLRQRIGELEKREESIGETADQWATKEKRS